MMRSDIAPSRLALAGAPHPSGRAMADGADTTVRGRQRREPVWRRVRRWTTPERAFAIGAGLYLLLCALSFLVVRPTTLYYFTDYWEHRAIVEEVMRDGTHLVDPIYGEAAASRQFTPWSLALGYLARIAGLGVDGAMAWGAMLVSVLFVLGVRDFARSYYAGRWAPALLLAALTCGWGLLPLVWTGFHPLRSQLHGNYYPASLVFALSFVAWARVMRLLRGERFGWASAGLLSAVVACSLVTHPLNAAFLIGGALALAAFEPGAPVARRAGVVGVIVAGVAASGLWPYFNPLSLAGAGLARGQQTFNNFGFFYDPLFVVDLLWPGLFALLGLRGLVRDSSGRMQLAALAAIVAAYVAGGIADVSVSHRLLADIALVLQLLLVTVLLAAIDGRPMGVTAEFSPRLWRGLAIGAAVLVTAQVAAAAQQLVQPWAMTGHHDAPLRDVAAEARQVRAALPGDARILGWDSAALVMPAQGLRVVAFPRPMPLSPSDAARQAASRRFFAPGVSACERRAIAARWGATHIAYLDDELPRRVQRELRALGPATSPAGRWRIIPAPPRC